MRAFLLALTFACALAGCAYEVLGKADRGSAGDCRCDEPPAPACDGPKTLLTYGAGTCADDGTCEYPSTAATCEHGCVGGRCGDCAPSCAGRECGDDGCGGACGSGRCTTPPPARCSDARTLTTFAATGECNDSGTCTYAATSHPCAHGCADGRCTDCTASCAGRTCGDDGCGGTCGTPTCDSPPPDTCASGTLTRFATSGTCTAAGSCSYTSTTTTCAAGCCANRCCEVVPANAARVGALSANGLVVQAPATFDTTACAPAGGLGACGPVTTGADDAELCVCRMDELHVGGTLRVTGSRALVLLVARTVEIRGTLDVSAAGTTSGPGVHLVYTTNASGQEGGAGGSFGTRGGSGGSGTSSAGVLGTAALVPLETGLSGQMACSGSIPAGGGGGAVQVVAGESIAITAAGRIAANGGGGFAGSGCNGAAGGGSGGGILLEAPVVQVLGGLYANGGGGGGGGGESKNGTAGADGRLAMAAAGGGDGDDGAGCPLSGYTSGGWGGNGAFGTSNAGPGGPKDSRGCLNAAYVGGGGGGGGAGRIRIDTRGGCACTGVVSPPASEGPLGVE